MMIISVTTAMSQQMPITVTPILTPPYTTSLSKIMNAKEFLVDYTDDLVEYYHGEDKGIQYFYKVINGEGVVIAIDAATKELYDTECRIGNILIDRLIKDPTDDN